MPQEQLLETAISHLSWQPQLNDYWLITLQIDHQLSNPQQLLTANFHFSETPEIPLSLFGYELSTNNLQLQFLSTHQNPEESPNQLTISFGEFSLPKADSNLLVMGENLRMAQVFAIAKHRQKSTGSTLAILHSDQQFPFAIKPARFMVDTAPPEAIGASTLLEDWKIANRLSSLEFIAGCAQMTFLEMFEYWLNSLQEEYRFNGKQQHWKIAIFASHEKRNACEEHLYQTELPTGLSIETVSA